MPEPLQTCSVCEKGFVAQFTYQSERQATADAAEQTRYFCSQRCLGQSHLAQSSVHCAACDGGFTVTRASQVIYLRGARNYACSDGCRSRLLVDERGLRSAAALPTATLTEASEPASLDRFAPRAASAPLASTSVMPKPVPVATASKPAASTVAAPQARVIAVFNHKGGTGKTTTAVTIASGLAARGKRTLMVDTDAQGNVAVSLGLGKVSRSLYHVLVMGMPLKDAVQTARENLDVLASNETLAAAELYLAGRQNRDRILATRLAQARANYEYIVVDCSPSLSLLNQNALVFADWVLCPVACDYLSLVGVRQVVKTIKNVNRLLSHPVQLWGVLPTLYDRRARICNEALETLREHFAERCLPPVRSAIRVKEAPSQGKTVFEYDPDSDVAADYAATLDRIILANAQTVATSFAGGEADPETTPEHHSNPLLAIA